VPATGNVAPQRPFKKLTPGEMAERRKLGLYYNCDEQYVRGHRCPRLFYLEVADFEEDTAIEEVAEEPEPVISLHALTGIRSEDTMQIQVKMKDRLLTALLDTGSTHNFVNLNTALSLQLEVCSSRGRVAVANGDKIDCHGLANSLRLCVGPDIFTMDAYAIPLDSFDIILGVQFLRTLGPILWDLANMSMTFWKNGYQVLWKGNSTRSMMHRPLPARVSTSSPTPMMDSLVQQFDDVFSSPTGLPPARPCDHRIHLMPGTTPVAVRPYRYPQLQKDELEAQCAAMLKQGTIRHSTSTFSAPVLLVKKADNSWCFCIDYRALNERTVKDKYPIPVFDELLDELNGAKFFTKLDLRSGYHQVRVHSEDIHKTAFRTHHDHFEFLVMPFGLSNGSATFQALMNEVLGSYLRRCVLVFFDDILIYSASWSEHLRHVKAVLETLRSNQLFVKQSKCSFGATSVAYLGHVISADGVAMDNSKVEAVSSWPVPQSTRGLCGFLGLAGYYRKFIKDFGSIVAPLTALLKKEGFKWGSTADTAFQELKKALSTVQCCSCPTLIKCSLWIVMLLVLDLGQSCIKDLGPWHSLVGRLQAVMSSLQLMNVNSLVSFRQFVTSDHISGVVDS
jgi:hypothetical protein